MTHEPEKTFSYRVRKYLIDNYGKDNVHDNEFLPERYRWADYYVEGPITDFAIEIENDFDSCFKGVSQALVYAAELEATPLVIVPPGHIEEPERSDLNKIVRIEELDV